MKLCVLGGCGGIGRDLVEQAIAADHDVTVLDLEQSLAAFEPPCPSYAVDVKAPETLSQAAQHIGPIDGFVNLCGYMAPPQSVTEYDPALWDDIISGNLTAAFHVARIIAPIVRSGGSIVQVGSGLGHNARPGFGAYAVAKAGIAALTRQLALELAPKIRVNCVAPSAVDTAFLRGGTGRTPQNAAPIDIEAYAQAIPLKRIAVPNDVTGPILFLLGAQSTYMTGQILHVNGGAFMP